jgi:hypothetical protein
MIQVIQGSIFDSKCDLLVIPCDSSGGVTRSVYSNLSEHGMPTSIGAVPYGSVHFRESKYEFASTLGYAASVDAKSIDSDPDAVKSIAMDLVRYSLSNQIRVVNLPLLGSGAGGLTPRQSYESLKGVFVDADKITFNIFCFTREVVQNVIAASPQQTLTTETVRHPRVFISYTANKSEDREWVKNLAEKLRANGVDARIDIYHLKPGFDLPQWMTNEIILADKVLLVCNRAYMEKADFRKSILPSFEKMRSKPLCRST